MRTRIGAVARLAWRPLLILVLTGVLGWWILSWSPRPPRRDGDATIDAEPADMRAWMPRPRSAAPRPGCEPKAARRCIEGDVWWIDGCDHAYEVADECGYRLCHEGACEPDGPPDCGDESPLGRCDGDVARGCEAGRPFAIDCGARGRRCVTTEYGPMCRARTDEDCDVPPTRSRCNGDELVACIDGRWHRFDCRTRGGVCDTPPGTEGARCVSSTPAPGEEQCGACGCPSEPTTERCDGTDNDGDGHIDENTDCGPIDVLAFVVVDAEGRGSHAPDDIEEELERLDAAFSREDDYGLDFRLAELVRIEAEGWLELDDEEAQAVFRSPTINPIRDAFYVPIVFTDRVIVGDVPRPGLSTGPNGMCGGVRRTPDPQPPGGAVVIAKRRWPTTVAHEVGHFLGLCHTHAPDVGVLRRWDADPDTVLEEADACAEPCTVEADGVCDTPKDPGPPMCMADPDCRVWCEDGGAPEPSNIMAYYPDCRTEFTEEQALLMRQMLALRRGWQPCLLGDRCPCDPLRADCPTGMSCRSWAEGDARTWRCDLDGASVPGGVCHSSLDCSLGTLCLEPSDGPSRCVRPCDEGMPTCECRHLEGFEIGVCVDDLR